MTAPKDLYPLSTQDAQSIPLDVVEVLHFTRIATSISAMTAVTLPTVEAILVLYATEDTLVSFADGLAAAPVVNGTFYADTFLVPAFTLLTVVPKTTVLRAIALGSAAGVLYLQLARRWAGLALPRQTNKY